MSGDPHEALSDPPDIDIALEVSLAPSPHDRPLAALIVKAENGTYEFTITPDAAQTLAEQLLSFAGAPHKAG